MKYKKGYLLGRLANGFEADKGRLVHAVIEKEVKMRPCPFNEWGRIEKMTTANVSLCGLRPGKRSVGWSFDNSGEEEREVTCPKCRAKLGKMEVV